MGDHSCSTFMLSHGGHLLIGHNLDEYVPVPGLVFVNPRGISKRNISWDDLHRWPSNSRRRLEWVSRYASLTCNQFGREFTDGGLNEAGLYVGEMTLLGTVYPSGAEKPKFYHHHWIQFLLDNYATVGEVLEGMGEIGIEGHCQWHFFLADASGEAAVIEFHKGETMIYRGQDLPYKVLCNAAYADELKRLGEYEGFGGSKAVDFSDKKGPARFVQAVSMLQKKPEQPTAEAARELAASILEQVDCGNNQWRLIFDVPARQLFYRTSRGKSLRNVGLNDFDLGPEAAVMMVDIHQDKAGNTRTDFQPFDPEVNRKYIEEAWKPINMGFVFNALLKPYIVSNLSNFPKDFTGRQGAG